MGLPPPEKLSGLDMQVKSIFIRPFSVMHSKFLIVDRCHAFMPSCNVSWENWLECCLAIEGPMVGNLCSFWRHIWGPHDFPGLDIHPDSSSDQDYPTERIPTASNLRSLPTPTHPLILLPSPHHASLVQLLPFISSRYPPPPTPLNTYILTLLNQATKSITLLTPNLTSPPVTTALLSALKRGVDVHIITNRKMMLLEQLLTARTITELEVWKLKRRYRKMYDEVRSRTSTRAIHERSVVVVVEEEEDNLPILEEGLLQPLTPPHNHHPHQNHKRTTPPTPGTLQISYFSPAPFPSSSSPTPPPSKTHIKLTIVDDRTLILGSGNMDTASWFSSQELGLGIRGGDGVGLVGGVWGGVLRALQGMGVEGVDR
ncbi:hypothetical protein MMC09_004698 [Bachmanniomyces sp. S44760]|nr:hypothetical protein [Bachmanniomyces sp. S44760]